MGLKERIQNHKDKNAQIKKPSKNQDSEVGRELANYIQTYLAWLKLQNSHFNETLTTEELTNYFFGSLNLPINIIHYMEDNPLQILSKVYEYIDRYKDKTEMFTINRKIQPKLEGNYKEKSDV